MAEKVQNSDDNEDLSTKVKNWVEKQGYSLEMRVAKIFQESGFTVSQFDYFVDQESRTIRQTDVVASISHNIGNSFVTVNLIIECKYAKSKPWVILVTQQKFDRFSFFGRVLNGKHPSDWKNLPTLQGRLVGRIALSLDRSTEIEKFEVNPAGYAIMEARLDSNYKPDPNQLDYAYEAIMQVGNSVRYHDDKNEEVFNNIIKSFEEGFGIETGYRSVGISSSFSLDLSIAVPLVIINGRLFESHLSDDNTIDVSEIESGFILMPYMRDKPITDSVPLSCIMVVTENNLSSTIPRLRRMMESILEQESTIRELLEFEESKISPLSKPDF